jgi:prepilin-type processing-associated H-X9-DG protein
MYIAGCIPEGEWKKAKMDLSGTSRAKNPDTPCMLVCPTGLDLQADKWLYAGGYCSSYGMNSRLVKITIHRIKKPSDTLCLTEKSPNINNASYLFAYNLAELQYPERYIHSRCTNVSFMDGHVESLGFSQDKKWIVFANP